MATRATATKATAAKATPATEAKVRTKTPAPDEVDFGAITPAANEANPFARGAFKTIPSDHPLLKAVQDSYDAGRPIDVATKDNEGTAKFLRRCGNQLGYGLRINDKEPGKVTFLARERQSRPRKPKSESE